MESMNGIIPLGFPEASVGIAYFLNVVWLFIDCNLLSVYLLKIMFCRIISILANRIRETFQKISGTPQSSHESCLYTGCKKSHPRVWRSPSMEDSHRAPGTLLPNTCSCFFLGFLLVYFFLVRNEYPTMHHFTFIPLGHAFHFFVFPCSYFHYRRWWSSLCSL